MKKLSLSAVLLGTFISLSIVSAQIIGDTAPDQASEGCTELSYNLTYKKSKDSNTNGEVSDLQYFLQDQGLLTAEPNGVFGPSTLRAVKSFQRKNGFIPSGYVGPMTRAKIKEMSCSQNSDTVSTDANQESTGKKVCKGIGSRSEGWYDSATNELIEYAKCSNTSTEPVACTMEYRSCADGSPMPRDSNCKWREDKCNVSNTKDKVSTLKIYIDNFDYPLHTKENITKEDAHKYCKDKAFSGNKIKCTWGGDELYSYVPNETTQVSYVDPIISSENSYTTLSLSYDNSVKEVSLSSKLRVKIRAGNEDMVIAKPDHPMPSNAYSFYGVLYDSKNLLVNYSGRLSVNIESVDYITDVGNYYILKAGKTALFNLKQEYEPKRLFAGMYYVKFGYTNTFKNDGGGYDLAKTNSVTVIGENAINANPVPVIPVPTTPTEAHGPNYNAMSCSNPTRSGLTSGQVACYGIWDYGNEFGGDPDMCPPYGYSSSQTGCKVQTKACLSGQAIATRVFNPTSMDVNSSDIAVFATNLKSSKVAVKQQIPTLWEYTCDGGTSSVNAEIANPTLSSTVASQNSSCKIVDVYAKSVPGYIYSNLYIKTSNLVATSGLPIGITGTGSWDNLTFSKDSVTGDLIASQTMNSMGVSYVLGMKNAIKLVQNGETICSSMSGLSQIKSSTQGQVLGAVASCVSIPRNMHRGAESSSVSVLQKFLQSKGLLAEVTGFYGDKTVEAVKDYQGSKGLPITGMVYDATRDAIQSETCQ